MIDYECVWKLRELSQEIRAVGHLIQVQPPDRLPAESSEVYEGTGKILERLGKRVRRIANQIEREVLEKTRPRPGGMQS